ncbi:MAG: hydroxymethylbilane synthase [Actinobacteria bacterium]|nr:MAG: hydroxymethylbilane synthase [Actinomycetota bacterium]
MANGKRDLVIGSRGSKLALWQAGYIARTLEGLAGVGVTIERIKTSGDMILDAPLAKIGGKGLFVKELETALAAGEIDLAVHSMKDVPTELPDGLFIAAMTEREDPRDVLVSAGNLGLDDLREGARIGTSSLRRRAQLLKYRPDLVIGDLRGNLDTRLRRIEEGAYDATILAAAGIDRMGWSEKIAERIPYEIMINAVGQGAIGVEIRSDDDFMIEMCGKITHLPTAVAVRAERRLMRRLEGGCQVPIGALGTLGGGRLKLQAVVASLDGDTVLRDEVSGPAADPEALGDELAERLLSQGANEILEAIRSCL